LSGLPSSHRTLFVFALTGSAGVFRRTTVADYQFIPTCERGGRQPCNTVTGRFIFGYDASGKVLACGGSGRPGVWVDPGTLIGVRQIGSKCVAEIHTLAPDNTGLFTAQSPDGVALFCAYPTDTWEPRPYR
jgi:hypothetical protein